MDLTNEHNINYIYHMIKNQIRKEYPHALIDTNVTEGMMHLVFVDNVQLNWIIIIDHNKSTLEYRLDVTDVDGVHDLVLMEIPSIGSLIGKIVKLVNMAVVPDYQVKDELFIKTDIK